MSLGVIEAEFHEYVRPTLNPILSDYCVNLTRINQDLINRQDTFPVVFNRFCNWLESHRTFKGLLFATPTHRSTFNSSCNTAFCTWTNCDFNHFIRLDVKRHEIYPSIVFKAWIDAKKLFQVSHKPIDDE